MTHPEPLPTAREQAHALQPNCRYGFGPHSLSCDRLTALIESHQVALAEVQRERDAWSDATQDYAREIERQRTMADTAEKGWHEALDLRKDEAIRGDSARSEVQQLKDQLAKVRAETLRAYHIGRRCYHDVAYEDLCALCFTTPDKSGRST